MHTCFSMPDDALQTLADMGPAGPQAGNDPWAQTLRLLDMLCAAALDATGLESGSKPRKAGGKLAHPAAAPRPKHGPAAPTDAVVTLVERLSQTHVVLRWCSPTCHYGDQVWIAGVARCKGVCAISGHLIKRGDAVYRPLNRKRLPPVNVDAMIYPGAL
jgi:hypothetical protein